MSKLVQFVACPPEEAAVADQRSTGAPTPRAMTWRLPATVLLMMVVLPVLLAAAVLTLPVLLALTAGDGLRQVLGVAPVIHRAWLP